MRVLMSRKCVVGWMMNPSTPSDSIFSTYDFSRVALKFELQTTV